MSEPSHAILVVDDEPTILRILQTMVTAAGFRIFATPDPVEALRLAKTETFAVVISDHQMPGMLGTELLSQIAIIQPETSRILITGVRSLDIVVDAVNRGEILRFVTKPWVRAEMQATLQNAVQRYELIHSKALLEQETKALNLELAAANVRLGQQIQQLELQRAQIDESRSTIQQNFGHSIELCHRILSTFHPALGEQTKTTVRICQQMAEAGEFTEEQKHILTVSAWLHDLGLSGLPRQYSSVDQHDQDQFPSEVRHILLEHPIYGQTLASFVDELQGVAETVRAHHERYDGSGYPDGLSGDKIPWTARCLAVVLHYVTCGHPHEKSIEELLNLSGRVFDPDAVQLFLRSTHPKLLSRPVKEIAIEDLQAGMQLATGLYSPTGLLLIPPGQRLDATTVSKLINPLRNTEFPQRLLIFT